MANLGTWTINTNGQYQKLSELTEITFIEGETYIIQGRFSPNIDRASKEFGYFLREGTTGEGFLCNSNPIQYDASDEKNLYIMNYNILKLNIAK